MSVAVVDDYAIARTIERIEREYGDLSVPAIAKNRCAQTSKVLRSTHGGVLVCAYGPRAVTGPSDAPGHVAVLTADDVIWDLTARQFWPDVAYPLVEPVAAWATRFTGLQHGELCKYGLVHTYTLPFSVIVPHP